MRAIIEATRQEKKERAEELARLGRLLEELDFLQRNWGASARGAEAIAALTEHCGRLNGELAGLEREGKL